jgi:alpha(1,3/1,4) fucosyltransferase
MYNIAIVPNEDYLLENKVFIDNEESTGTFQFAHHFKMHLEESKYKVRTIDLFHNINEVDYVVFFKLDFFYLNKCLSNQTKTRLIYFAWEPEIISKENSKKSLFRLLDYFDYIYTWHSDLQYTDSRFKKLVYAQKLDYNLSKISQVEFSKKIILSQISSNKTSIHKDELYSLRAKINRRACDYFGSSFRYYGFGWKSEPCYGGEVQNKIQIFKNSRFAVCIENSSYRGYITEKIWDIFKSNIVPICYGNFSFDASIPSNCYIDMSLFSNLNDLFKYIESMSLDDYNLILDNINTFINSRQSDVFRIEYFMKQFENDMSLLGATFRKSWFVVKIVQFRSIIRIVKKLIRSIIT